MIRASNTKATYWVIAMATVALLGLSFLQILNLKSSITTNRQIFLQKVDLASASIAASFALTEGYPALLFETEGRLLKTKKINDPEMDRVFRAIIDPTLRDHGIDMAYEYAVYTHKHNDEGFRFVLGDSGASLDFELIGCENPDERGHGWANLTCSTNLVQSDYHLALFFPDQDAYVFAQSLGALGLSILFILLLVGCFTYTLLIIRRQKKLSEIKNDFINNLTHEFKTPISSINLSANLLKSEGPGLDHDRKTRYLNLIDQESKRLEGQVDKILQIAMLDSGNFTMDKTEVDVHDVIKRVVKSMSLAIEQRNGTVDLNLVAQDSTIMGDSTHILNIIYNLLDNALKYTLEVPHIEISTSNQGHDVKISIRDNGVGIGEEIQKFIFDKFYRAKSGNLHDAKGFGLGLSYVKKLMDAHEGKIDLISNINKGTEFRLYIPTG